MRCIHFLDTLEFAGTERHVIALCAGLRDLGTDVWIAGRAGSALEKAAHARKILWLPIAARNPLGMSAALRRHAGVLDVDVVHTHNGRTNLAAALMRRSVRRRIVTTQHFIDPQFTTYRGVKRLVANAAHRWVNHRADAIVAVSAAARQAMIERERVALEKITAILNGIEPVSQISPSRELQLRDELAISPEACVVTTVARLTREKGVEHLIDAVPRVVERVPGAVFVIVGDGPLREELVARAAGRGAASHVRFVGFREDATDFIALSDVFALPSPAEPFGLVLLEAMSLAVPVVAVAAGGPIEIVADELTGRLINRSDLDDLARAINSLLENPGRSRIGEAGRQRFLSQFTAETMAKKTLALYFGLFEPGTREPQVAEARP